MLAAGGAGQPAGAHEIAAGAGGDNEYQLHAREGAR